MSTEINGAYSDIPRVRLTDEGGRTVYVAVKDTNAAPSGCSVKRADFIAAVETECDGIFIPRAELPPTGLTSDGVEVYAGDGSDATRWMKVGRGGSAARKAALAHLAIAEYLDAHPPVDEAQVEALADAIREAEKDGPAFATTIARRLVAAGWSK